MLLETRAISSSQHTNTHKHIQSSALLGYNITNKTKQNKNHELLLDIKFVIYCKSVGLRKKGKEINSQRKNKHSHTHTDAIVSFSRHKAAVQLSEQHTHSHTRTNK